MRTRRVTLPIVLLLVPVLFILVAVALSSHREASHQVSILVLVEPDWGGRWETGVPGVKFIPPAVTPTRKVAVGFAMDIESPTIAEEVIRRLGLRMTPDELFRNLNATPTDNYDVRLTYRDPVRLGGSPQRARRIVRTVAMVAGERIHKEIPYDYAWVLWGSANEKRGPARERPRVLKDLIHPSDAPIVKRRRSRR